MDPIRTTSRKIGVSPNSLVRLAQKLGFENFDAFSASFRDALVTEQRVEDALALLKGAKATYVTAARASYALSSSFHYAGQMALPGLQLIPRHLGSAVDELVQAEPGACLLAVTLAPYSAETIISLRFAQQKGVKLIVICDSEVIAPGITPDVNFPVAVQSQHHFGCFTGAKTVLGVLLGHLILQCGEDARRRTGDYQAARGGTGAYWKARPLPRIKS
ncbi:Sugar isomerase (SIS) [Roseobacter sp. SK209-2-6]|nr:Sugar isomerase (SIS) [Roseobacter sp. SK209-2-6]